MVMPRQNMRQQIVEKPEKESKQLQKHSKIILIPYNIIIIGDFNIQIDTVTRTHTRFSHY